MEKGQRSAALYVPVNKFLQFRFGFFHDGRESVRIADRHISQHLAVELNVRLLHAVNKPAVAEAVQAGCRINASDPQFAQVALAVSPVAVRVPEAFQHGFVCAPEKAAACAEIPLVVFDYFFMP